MVGEGADGRSSRRRAPWYAAAPGASRVVREVLLEAVRRYGRVGHEREDLAHDLIVAALRRAVPLESEQLLVHAHGAARRGATLAGNRARPLLS
jgi:hypothetical protein